MVETLHFHSKIKLYKHFYYKPKLSSMHGHKCVRTSWFHSRSSCMSSSLFFTKDFITKDEHKDQHKTIFEHKYICTLAKLATAEGIELPSLSGRVRNLTAELSASAWVAVLSNSLVQFRPMRHHTAIWSDLRQGRN